MGKVKTEIEQSTTVENATFDLQLPDDINVPPWLIVDLPRNKQAMIYKTSVTQQMNNQNTTVYSAGNRIGESTRYDVFIVNKKTLSTQNAGDNYYSRNIQHFDTLADLKHHLYDLARLMSMKRRTKRMVNVEDVREANDDDD